MVAEITAQTTEPLVTVYTVLVQVKIRFSGVVDWRSFIEGLDIINNQYWVTSAATISFTISFKF